MNLTEAAILYGYQAPAMIAWIVGCTIAIVCNLVFITVVYKSEKFRTKSNYVVCTLCAAEILQSCGWTWSAIKRLIYYAYNWSDTVDRTACLVQILPVNAFQRMVECVTIALSLDRFLALSFPVFYRATSATRYVLTVNVVCCSLGLLIALVAFLDVDNRMLKACTLALALGVRYQWFQYVLQDVQAAMAAALDLGALIVLWRRVCAIRRLPVTVQREERKKLELGTFRTLLVIALLYSVGYIMSAIYGVFLLYLDKEDDIRWAPGSTLIPIVNSASHLFVYLAMSKSFRQEFKKVFGFGDTAIVVRAI